MDKILYNVLDNINQGIIITDENSNILLWNQYMENITGIDRDNAMQCSISTILPVFQKHYFRQAISGIVSNGHKHFFSAAFHGDLIGTREKLNLQISRFESDSSKLLLFEFMDVTSEFIRVNELKQDINQLHLLNQKLKEKEKIIKDLAYYDELTGVANRTLFYKLSEKLLLQTQKNHELLGLMFIDVDQFKSINDTYGHIAGDKVLMKVAQILLQATTKNDVVARYGGDEFLLLLPNIQKTENCNIVISKIVGNNDKIIAYNDARINISLSIGVSFCPNDGENIDQLILKADSAMYAAKKRTGNAHSFAIAKKHI